jgi:hypothetical protein
MRTNEGGLSLVEGLVAAGLVALGFLAVLNLFPAAYSNITYGGNQTLAANYAPQKIEQLKNLSFDAIDNNTCVNTCENLPTPGFCRYCLLTPSVGVGVGSLQGDLKKVQVTVTWPGQYRPGSLSVETVFTR